MAADSSGVPGAPCRHHAQLGACESRAKYREGWRPRAVKVLGKGRYREEPLWAEPPQFAELFLIRSVTQTLHQLRCPSLDMLRHLSVLEREALN